MFFKCDFCYSFVTYIKSQYERDEEGAEEFKIISFVTMVMGCSTIGIAYGTGA